jgi:pimeloyl-ACP methyl ester carboxylesterase
MRNLRLREDGRLYWHWDPAFTRYDPEAAKLTANMFAQAAAALTVPVLLIRGGRSRVLSAEGVAEFRGLVPHAEFVDVAGADHMVAGDANDSFNDAVLGFLAQHAQITNSH